MRLGGKKEQYPKKEAKKQNHEKTFVLSVFFLAGVGQTCRYNTINRQQTLDNREKKNEQVEILKRKEKSL